MEDITLSPEQAKPFLDIIGKELFCKFDEKSLKGQPIYAYPHDGGWKVKGLSNEIENGLWWLYVVCPKCGYRWALHYLGVPRDFDGSA